jgi:hypothetical protein
MVTSFGPAIKTLRAPVRHAEAIWGDSSRSSSRGSLLEGVQA